jgi:hypothetical protein
MLDRSRSRIEHQIAGESKQRVQIKDVTPGDAF